MSIGGKKMSKECKKCEHSNNLKGCAQKHAATARKLMSKGKIKEADENLVNFEKHLKET